MAMGALKRTSGRRAEVKRMRVRPGCWRRGYGREVLSALERRAAELGYVTLHLDTTVGQTAARRLYEKNGFREARRAPSSGFACFTRRIFARRSSRASPAERVRRNENHVPIMLYFVISERAFWRRRWRPRSPRDPQDPRVRINSR